MHEQQTVASAGSVGISALEAQTVPADTSASCEDLLEDAVDQVCAPLIGTLPRAERLARRAVLRQELDTLVAAHSELDTTAERALSEALAHFARLHPVLVLRSALQTQASVQHSRTRQTVAVSSLSASSSMVTVRPATLLALGLLMPVYVAHVFEKTEWLRALLHLSDPGLYRLELFAVPLLTGLLVGLLTRREAVRGVFTACTIIALYAVALPSILMALAYTKLLPFESSSVYSWLVANPMAGYAGLVVWPLLGCTGASAGAALRRKTNALPRIKKMKRTHACYIQK